LLSATAFCLNRRKKVREGENVLVLKAIVLGVVFGVLVNLLIGFDSLVGVNIPRVGHFIWHIWPGVLLGIFVALLYVSGKSQA
jgi:hypothetical protein